jgi:hypothetical protein
MLVVSLGVFLFVSISTNLERGWREKNRDSMCRARVYKERSIDNDMIKGINK